MLLSYFCLLFFCSKCFVFGNQTPEENVNPPEIFVIETEEDKERVTTEKPHDQVTNNMLMLPLMLTSMEWWF